MWSAPVTASSDRASGRRTSKGSRHRWLRDAARSATVRCCRSGIARTVRRAPRATTRHRVPRSTASPSTWSDVAGVATQRAASALEPYFEIASSSSCSWYAGERQPLLTSNTTPSPAASSAARRSAPRRAGSSLATPGYSSSKTVAPSGTSPSATPGSWWCSPGSRRGSPPGTSPRRRSCGRWADVTATVGDAADEEPTSERQPTTPRVPRPRSRQRTCLIEYGVGLAVSAGWGTYRSVKAERRCQRRMRDFAICRRYAPAL